MHVRALELSLYNVSARVGTSADKESSKKLLLDDISVQFKPGTLSAILGPSGAGKSTLLQVASMRLGRRISTTGEILVNGRPLSSKYECREFAHSVAFVPQHIDLCIDNELTAAENLYVNAMLRWSSRVTKQLDKAHDESEEMYKLVIDTLCRLGLLNSANTLASNLSGGQKRRLAIAIECLKPCPVMFLDEPTSGQDAVTALEIVQLLRKLAIGDSKTGPKTIIMVIHQPRSEILSLIDNVTILSAGTLMFSGNPKEELETFSQDLLRYKDTLDAAPLVSNIADIVMDNLAVLSPASKKRLRKQYQPHVKIMKKSSFNNDGIQLKRDGIASIRLRLGALMFRRQWKQEKMALVQLFIVCPLSIVFAGALPNWISGGDPELQEIVAQILLSFLQPVVILLGVCLYDMVLFSRSFKWLHRSMHVNGFEATVEAIISSMATVCLFLIPPITICVVAGWSQYWTAQMIFRTWGFALAGTFLLVLLLYASIASVADETRTMHANSLMGSAVQFWVLAYTGLGVAFGGLMYRVDQISSFFKVLSYTSAGYYTQTGIMAVVLHAIRDGECLSEGTHGSCGGVANQRAALYASLAEMSKTPFIPTYGLLILCLGCLTCALALLFVYAGLGAHCRLLLHRGFANVVSSHSRGSSTESTVPDSLELVENP